MTYKRMGIIAAISLGVIIAASVQINKIISGVGEDASYKKIPVYVPKTPPEKKEARPKKESSHAIKMSDTKALEKYGITITPRLAGPSTPEEWQSYVEENLKKSEVLDSPEGKEVIQTMQVTEEEYTKKMKDVEDHIGIVQRRLEENVFDKDNQEQLQNTYKLKAVGSALKNRVVKPDDTFISGILSSTSDVPEAPSQAIPIGE